MNRNPFGKKTVGFYNVMATEAHSPGCNSVEYRPLDHDHKAAMISPPKENTSTNKSVYFENKREEEKATKQKFLTQKYGLHQREMIRKRLAVEDWLYDQLRDLYNCENDQDDHDCKLDLEEVLNYDKEIERREYALNELIDAKKPQEDVFRFVDELVKKANTL